MTIEFTVICDGCGTAIAADRTSARAARAEAQLNRGAVSSGGEDHCRDCRASRMAEIAARTPAPGHSTPSCTGAPR